jgi:EAL domain-containing protein (putative c-di-GMP-specific phosphodiesterase class I)
MLSVSIGIAGYPAHGRHAVDVISNADLAVHHVKNNGKNGVVFFEESMLEHLLGKIEMEKNITYALENDNFLLYYQPQYFADSQKLRGFEALIRMQDDNDGVISPVRFIPVAEKNGSIVEIGEWVINQAMEDYAYWKKEYGFEGVISINISAIQFRQIGFENILYDAIERHRIDPSKIEIEITESVFVDNQIQVIETVKRIRQKGIRVSLDDFGTGYSSLSYLRRFPVDTLKIDKSFVDFIGKEEKSDIIISALVGVARSLGLEIVAEGVETTEQSDILKDLKCHVIQGYLYGKPMDGSSAEDLIRRKM